MGQSMLRFLRPACDAAAAQTEVLLQKPERRRESQVGWLNGKGGRERARTGGAHGVVAASKAVRNAGGGRSGADLSGRVTRFCEGKEEKGSFVRFPFAFPAQGEEDARETHCCSGLGIGDDGSPLAQALHDQKQQENRQSTGRGKRR
jgi:hypothetical protein